MLSSQLSCLSTCSCTASGLLLSKGLGCCWAGLGKVRERENSSRAWSRVWFTFFLVISFLAFSAPGSISCWLLLLVMFEPVRWGEGKRVHPCASPASMGRQRRKAVLLFQVLVCKWTLGLFVW